MPASFQTRDGDLVMLTQGQHVTVWRRRQGWTQQETCRHLGVSYRNYLDWEKDRLPCKMLPLMQLGKILPHEKCLIYRLQCGKSQTEIAAEMGFCPYTIRKMEKGLLNPDRLLGYWEC